MRRIVIPFSAICRHLRRPVACARTIPLTRPITALARSIVIVPIVSVEVVVVVNVDVAVSPVAVSPVTAPPRAPRDSGSERQTHSRIPTRIVIGIIRISWRTVDNGWIVRRDVDHLRVRIFNDNHVFPAFASRLNYLLRTGLQGSFIFSFGAHALHCFHHVRLLSEERVS